MEHATIFVFEDGSYCESEEAELILQKRKKENKPMAHQVIEIPFDDLQEIEMNEAHQGKDIIQVWLDSKKENNPL